MRNAAWSAFGWGGRRGVVMGRAVATRAAAAGVGPEMGIGDEITGRYSFLACLGLTPSQALKDLKAPIRDVEDEGLVTRVEGGKWRRIHKELVGRKLTLAGQLLTYLRLDWPWLTVGTRWVSRCPQLHNSKSIVKHVNQPSPFTHRTNCH